MVGTAQDNHPFGAATTTARPVSAELAEQIHAADNAARIAIADLEYRHSDPERYNRGVARSTRARRARIRRGMKHHRIVAEDGTEITVSCQFLTMTHLLSGGRTLYRWTVAGDSLSVSEAERLGLPAAAEGDTRRTGPDLADAAARLTR